MTNRISTAVAAVAAFLIFAGIYLVVAAATGGIGGTEWAVAVVGGLVFAGLAAAVAAGIGRRRSGGG